MDEFLKNLHERLRYVSHEYIGADAVRIDCRMERGTTLCPYCGKPSAKVNRRYFRTLKDVPFGDKKVVLRVKLNSYFCHDKDCAHSYFSEAVSFAEPFATRTKRLDNMILQLTTGNSSIGSERYLRRNVANVSDNTVNRIIKKNAEKRSR